MPRKFGSPVEARYPILRTTAEGMNAGGIAIEIGWSFRAVDESPLFTIEQREGMQESLAAVLETWLDTLTPELAEAARAQVDAAARTKTTEEPRMNLYPYYVNYVQAAEPNELPDADGIAVEIDTPADEMGLPRVIVRGRSHEQIVDYVRANWGDDDGQWFRSYIVDRIEAVQSPHEWVVTTTPDDPSLSALWVGTAVDALHALDQFADQEVIARYSDSLAMDDESFGNLIGLHAPRGLWAIYTNATVWAIPLQTNTGSDQTHDPETGRLTDHGRELAAREAAKRLDLEPVAIDCECGSGPFDSEASVQRHRDQWHKTTPIIEEALPRTVLVHVNVDVPAEYGGDELADDVRRELERAIEVGGGSDHTPLLLASDVVIADAEEV